MKKFNILKKMITFRGTVQGGLYAISLLIGLSAYTLAYGTICSDLNLHSGQSGLGELYSSTLSIGNSTSRILVTFGPETEIPDFIGNSDINSGAWNFLKAWPVHKTEPFSSESKDQTYSKGLGCFSHVILLSLDDHCYLGWYKKKSGGPDRLELTPVSEIHPKEFVLGRDLLNPNADSAGGPDYSSVWRRLTTGAP